MSDMTRELLLTDELRATIAASYLELAAEIASLGAACWARGHCCDFTRMEHRLYASSVELAYVREKHGAAAAPGAVLCPFWTNGLCTERERRPLGCRTHYCDPRYRTALEDLHEKHLGRLRRAADAAGFPWRYGPFVEELSR